MPTEFDDPLAEVRAESLRRANKVRIGRARLKRELKNGRDPVRVLQRPPAAARGMKVYDFLQAIPTIGKRRADRMLVATRISPNRTLGRLDTRQREALTHGIRERGGSDDEFPG